MRRVVITGLGIVSSIGANTDEVIQLHFVMGNQELASPPDYAEHGFRSQIHGLPDIEVSDHIEKRQLRFMGEGAAYNFIAMQDAINDSGLTEREISNERTGLIMGSGGPSTRNHL